MNNFSGVGFWADETVMLLLVVGVTLCSLLCVAAALRNGGEVLERPVLLLLCQFYLVLVALMQLYAAGGAVMGQVAGFLIFGLAIGSIFFRKNNFRATRYCIALGATLAACVMLF